jgi:DNA-binding NtrC family response regulator
MESTPVSLVVVDDDEEILKWIQMTLVTRGFKVRTFNQARRALEEIKLGSQTYDLVLSDIQIPDMSGLEFLSEIRAVRPQLGVLMMTAYGSVNVVIEALRLGASDFIQKPFTKADLILAVERLVRLKERGAVPAPATPTPGEARSPIIAKSQDMQKVMDLARRVAFASANVLITGESGTGKEVIAKVIHQLSPRGNKPLVAINCAAIPEGLLESELFGHAKGSFTGAVQNRRGLFREANGGTLFLDEIGDLSLPLQAKILRVLQEKKVRPVGSNEEHFVDVRIVSATHKNLEESIRKGDFRGDLFYRLNVIPIHLTPLRKRSDDILPLAQHFLGRMMRKYEMPNKRLSPEATQALLCHDWPGNVRELENVIERAVILSGDIIEREHLFVSLQPTRFEKKAEAHLFDRLEPMPLKNLELLYIQYVLRKTGGRKDRAAALLQIDRKTLFRKLSEHQKEVENSRLTTSSEDSDQILEENSNEGPPPLVEPES